MARNTKLSGGTSRVEEQAPLITRYTDSDAARVAVGADTVLRVRVWHNPDMKRVFWELYDRKSNRFVQKGDCEHSVWRNWCREHTYEV